MTGHLQHSRSGSNFETLQSEVVERAEAVPVESVSSLVSASMHDMSADTGRNSAADIFC